LILAANTLVFLFQLSLGERGLEWFVNNFAMVPARWQFQPGWFAITLVTSMFMHGGWIHFLSNMWILFIFGDNVEDRMGPIGFLGFYLLGGLAAGLLQFSIAPNSLIPTLGASGAIAGVMGAYIVLFPSARVVTLIPIFFFFTTVNIPAVLYLGIWFVTQFYSGLMSLGAVTMGGVAWWAHIGGFVFGLLMVRRFLFRPPPRPKPTYFYQTIEPPNGDRNW
jgi:membrane associated rhomboid family serine protease